MSSAAVASAMANTNELRASRGTKCCGTKADCRRCIAGEDNDASKWFWQISVIERISIKPPDYDFCSVWHGSNVYRRTNVSMFGTALNGGKLRLFTCATSSRAVITLPEACNVAVDALMPASTSNSY
jgi:hypothetical protein